MAPHRQPESETEIQKKADVALWLQIFKRYPISVIVLGLFIGYGPAKDGITGLLPVRGNQRTEEIRTDNKTDFTAIMLKLVAMTSDSDQVKTTCDGIKTKVDEMGTKMNRLENRIDNLYERPTDRRAMSPKIPTENDLTDHP